MTRSLNRLAIGLLVLMVALLVQLTRIQVFQRAELNAMPGNQRTLLTEYSRERGPILVDRAPIAESVETDDELKYLRTYPIGPMFASATGFYSIVYGATGLEKAENEVLSGEDPRLFVDRMQQLFAGREIQGGSVTTTLDGAAQKAAWDGLRGQGGVGGGHRAEHRTHPGPGAEPVVRPQRAELAQLQVASTPTTGPRGRPGQAAAQPSDRQDEPAGVHVQGGDGGRGAGVGQVRAGQRPPRAAPPTRRPGPAWRIPNYFDGPCGPNDEVTLADALAISCNTAFAWLGNELGDDALRDQAQKFGFEESFEIPLRAATSRFPADPDEPQTAMSAIGQFDVRATTHADGDGGRRGGQLRGHHATRPGGSDRGPGPDTRSRRSSRPSSPGP